MGPTLFLISFIFTFFNTVSCCPDGYYGSDCDQLCDSRCLTCNFDSVCTTCPAGTYGSFCQNTCPPNCASCTLSNSSTVVCTSCKDGYFDNNDECRGVCKANCKSCSTYNDCLECKPDQACGNITCGPNCAHCNLNGKCSLCTAGYWGSACTNLCSVGCVNGACATTTGECNCKERFTGLSCTVCEARYFGTHCNTLCHSSCYTCTSFLNCTSCNTGFYGENCNRNCSVGCNRLSCDRWTGMCISDPKCIANFTGDYCCPAGHSGQDCQLNTTACHANCEHCGTDGTCSSCNTGYWGINCTNTCSLNCTDSLCQKHDGYCVNCKSGKYGNACDSECPSQCFANTCYREGTCNVGCKNGYSGDRCTIACGDNCLTCQQAHKDACKVCISGRYGHNSEYLTCSNECNQNCKDGVCNGSSGHCFMGCADKFWGNMCSKKCPLKCKNGLCLQVDGSCSSGCVDGYTGTECDCQTSCSNCSNGMCFNCTDGYFVEGGICAPCLDNCINEKCSGNGSCLSGCKNGFYGIRCDRACTPHCKNGVCNATNGACVNGCEEGYVEDRNQCTEKQGEKEKATSDELPVAIIGGAAGGGGALLFIVVIIIAVFIVRRRKNKPTAEQTRDQFDTIEELEANGTADFSNVDHTGDASNLYAVVNKPKKNSTTSAVSVTNKAYEHPVEKRSSKRPSYIEPVLEIDDDDVQVPQQTTDTRRSDSSKPTKDYHYNTASRPVSKLADFVAEKNRDFYKAEFEKFPHGLRKDYKVSQTKENMPKNRYRGIYPYDDSRVKVQGEDTDYINASFIDGYRKKNAYIASLGPAAKQMQDFGVFWKMIWQQRVDKIVMLTNLIEHGRSKCDQYWPRIGTTQTYGGIGVTCHSDDVYADFTLRAFTLKKGREERHLHQLQFTAWPDKGIPDDVTGLVEFRQKNLGITSQLGGPVLVHCSAGIGRTGTYIGLDILTKEGETEKAVDIPRCVRQMRQNRPNMVQTAEQYQFLYNAVVHALAFNSKPIAAENFVNYMAGLQDQQLNHQFQQLQRTLEKLSETEADAVRRNSMVVGKNRDNADIPGDAYRPRLSLNRKPGSSDYINAVYVNSFKAKRRYLVAQSPLPGTVLDFLTLVFQENCSCIVSFEPDVTNQDVGEYFPADNQVLSKGVFNVSCQQKETHNTYIQRKLKLRLRNPSDNSTQTRLVPHLQFTGWNAAKSTPDSAATFLHFVNHVDKTSKDYTDQGPILIHCLDGAGKSGLLCVVSVLLQKMEIEHEVSVVNTVRQVKSRRPGAIPNVEQFAFCHECVSEFLQSYDTYSNFGQAS